MNSAHNLNPTESTSPVLASNAAFHSTPTAAQASKERPMGEAKSSKLDAINGEKSRNRKRRHKKKPKRKLSISEGSCNDGPPMKKPCLSPSGEELGSQLRHSSRTINGIDEDDLNGREHIENNGDDIRDDPMLRYDSDSNVPEEDLAVRIGSKKKKTLKKKSRENSSFTKQSKTPRGGITRELDHGGDGGLVDPDRQVHLLASAMTKILDPAMIKEFIKVLTTFMITNTYAVPTYLPDRQEGLAVLASRAMVSDVSNKVNALFRALDLLRVAWKCNS